MTVTAARRGGFTLIELLVVVVIIGIVSSVVLMSLGVLGDDRDLRQEVRRMASLLELAADEAVLQGRDFGVEILQGGYRFVEFDPFLDRWHEVLGDDLLRQRDLPETMRFELFIEDRRVLLNENAAKLAVDDDEDNDRSSGDYAPHGLLLSSGEVSPFSLELHRDADRRMLALAVAANGEIEITENERREN